MSDEGGPERRGNVRQWLPLIVIGLVGLYVLLFVVMNRHTVKVSFVVHSTHLSLIWVILLSVVAGAVLGNLVSRLRRRRRR
jgi:uncharacterized integral membrane protein